MFGRDIIVVGASAGGVEALSQLVRGLPPGLPAALFVVCHFPGAWHSVLPDLLSRRGALLATHAQDGEPVRPGHIYVAPPDYHLLLRDGHVQLSHGPRENHNRPAIDPLFRSAARAYGPRVVGVILSGMLYDGTAGLLAVRAAGGVAVVQDPAEADFPAMPLSARTIAGVDHVLPVDEIAPLLKELATQPAPAKGDSAMADPLEKMHEVVERDMAAQQAGGRAGQVAVFSCPECGGTLWQVDRQELTQFRCHVGHVYNGEMLLVEQEEALEAARWTAVRTFREKSVLARQLAAQERQRGNTAGIERFEDEARVAERYGELIQQYLLSVRAQAPVKTPEGAMLAEPARGPGPDSPPPAKG